MAKAAVFTAEGERDGERELPESLFDGTVHQAAMWQTVKAYMANQRRGTASTKNRARVRGGSRKPWRQKGTGRARQGSIRSPQWRGGGRVFGPTAARNYKQRVPKKLNALARQSAFNARAEDEALHIVALPELDAPKTKRVVKFFDTLDVDGNVLVLTTEVRETFRRSARNLPGVRVMPFKQASAYDVLWADTVLVEDGALDGIEEQDDE